MSMTSAQLTGSIGNARMVLRMKQGESIDKCILVKNVNPKDVTISLDVTGDLADAIVLQEKEFALAAKTDKNACFTLTAKKSGTTETKINIKFAPVDGGNGVGLSSTIIVIAEKKNIFESTENYNYVIAIGATIVFIVILALLMFMKSKRKSSWEVPEFSGERRKK
jgi:hypothetical protein